MSDFLFIALFLVAFFEFTHDVIEIDAGIFPHDEEMIEKVAGLIDDFFFVLVLVGDDDFGGFFTDLLIDLVFAFALQIVRIGLILRMGAAVFDFFKEGVKDGETTCFFLILPLGEASEEAGRLVCMAGGAIGNDLHDEGVCIAVYENFLYVLEVGGFFALVPELLAASGEEPGLSCLDGFLEGFLIHVRHHEDLAASGVLDDGGHEAFVVEGNILNIYCFHNFSPFWCKGKWLGIGD